MGDAEIFAGGVFVTLWLVSFFGYSAFQLRRGYRAIPPGTGAPREALKGPITGRASPVISSSAAHESLSTH